MKSQRCSLKIRILAAGTVFLIFISGCTGGLSVPQGEFGQVLSRVCKQKYQTVVSCTAVGDTVWIYLPYNHEGRKGIASVKDEGEDLYVDHEINSFNPYRTIDPTELKFLVQKVLGEIRGLLLRTAPPYKFFVLVVTDIISPGNRFEDWYIGYMDDIKKYGVGKDFSGEGYSRLTWYPAKIDSAVDANGQAVSRSYLDLDGIHVNYHDITRKEFVMRQIEWRVYKRFTSMYYKIPFDLTALERQDEILHIVKTVLTAYNFKEFDKVYFTDRAISNEKKQIATTYDGKEVERLSLDRDAIDKILDKREIWNNRPYIGGFLKDFEKLRTEEIKRKPAF
jgi:hypothetical protein